MRFFKILLLPFVIVWRLVFGIIRFFLFTQLLLTAISLLVLAALAYYFFKGNGPLPFHP